MVDTTKALEGKYLTAELVKNSPTKQLLVLTGGSYEEATFNGETEDRLSLKIEIDKKFKTWRPNRDTVQNLQVYGKDSENWVGKQVKLQVIRIQGKDSIIGMPI